MQAPMHALIYAFVHTFMQALTRRMILLCTRLLTKLAHLLLKEDRIWDVRWDNTYITARFDAELNKTRMWWNSQARPSFGLQIPRPPR